MIACMHSPIALIPARLLLCFLHYKSNNPCTNTRPPQVESTETFPRPNLWQHGIRRGLSRLLDYLQHPFAERQ